MKLVFLAISTITILSKLEAQIQLVSAWEKIQFDENHSKSSEIHSDSDKNTWMITTQTAVNSSLNYFLTKYDSLGEELWKQHYAGNNVVYSFLYAGFKVDKSGNSYVGFSDGLGEPNYKAESILVKYSTDGEVLWDKRIGDNIPWSNGISDLDIDSLDRLCVFGFTSGDSIQANNCFIGSVNPVTGEWLWNAVFPGNFFPHKIAIRGNEIIAFTTEFKPGGKFYRIIRLNFSGQIIGDFSKPYSATYLLEFNHISATGDVLFGNRSEGYTVAKVDMHGDTLWNYAYPNLNGYVYSIVEDDSLNTYATGTIFTPDKAKGVTTKFSPQGQLLWQQVSEPASSGYGTAFWAVAVDSTLVFAAGATTKVPGKANLFFAGYDRFTGEERFSLQLPRDTTGSVENLLAISDGFLFSGSTNEGLANTAKTITGRFRLSKTSAIPILTENLLRLAVFPNPASDEIHLQIPPECAAGNYRLLGFNSTGQQLFNRPVSDSEMTIDARFLPTGLLKLQLMNNQKLIATSHIIITR